MERVISYFLSISIFMASEIKMEKLIDIEANYTTFELRAVYVE